MYLYFLQLCEILFYEVGGFSAHSIKLLKSYFLTL